MADKKFLVDINLQRNKINNGVIGTYTGTAIGGGIKYDSNLLWYYNGTQWVSLSTDTDTWRAINVNGTQLLGTATNTGAANFKSGTYVTVTGSGNDLTFEAVTGSGGLALHSELPSLGGSPDQFINDNTNHTLAFHNVSLNSTGTLSAGATADYTLYFTHTPSSSEKVLTTSDLSTFAGGMVYKGTIAGTAPAAASDANKGWVYMASADSGSGVTPVYKKGDLIISNGSSWEVVPAGDETIGTLASSTSAQTVPSSPVSFGTDITLHKVAWTGTYSDLIGTPTLTDRTILKVGNTSINANHLASTPEAITFAGDTWLTPAANTSTKTITYTHKSGTAPTQTATTAATVDGWGETATINTPQLTVDAAGHVTAIGNAATTITLPSNPNTDNTKLVSGAASSAATGITANTGSATADSSTGVTVAAGNKWIETAGASSTLTIGHKVFSNVAGDQQVTYKDVNDTAITSPHNVTWGETIKITSPKLTYDEAGHMVKTGTTAMTLVMPHNPASGSTHKVGVDNAALTPTSGVATWTVDISSLGLASGDTDYSVSVRCKTASTTWSTAMGLTVGEEVECQIIHTSNTSVTIKINTDSAIQASSLRATIIG